MSGLLPSRGIRWVLLVLACVSAISLFLLATASANTELFAGRYNQLLVLNGALTFAGLWLLSTPGAARQRGASGTEAA